MAFSSDLAKLVADQLTRFVTLNRHQLAGQVANLDFWMAQVRNALETIDGYGVRFVRLSMNQDNHLAVHGSPDSTGKGYSGYATNSPARRIPDRELQKARRALTDAVANFLDRCLREQLIQEAEFAAAIKRLGIGQR